MTNLNVIENKISAIRKYLKILRDCKKYSRKEIEDNLTIRGAVERYLYLATQSAIDLAEAVISFKGFRKPATMGESFHILSEEKIISGELTKKMIKLAGFRNVIAHEYEKINYDIVYDVLQKRLTDIEKFLLTIQEVILK